MKENNPYLYFVTENVHKYDEVSKLFHKESLNFQLKQCKLKTVEIQANSNRDVVIYKLNSVKDKISGSFFIEDAGFYVDEPLKGFPGVYSSYVFKTIGNEGILKLIDNFEETKAHFLAIIAFYFKPEDEIFLFEGKSPNIKMQNLFQKFRAWLTKVYTSIKTELNAIYKAENGKDLPILTGEVRQVMDRMLSSSEEIEQAESIRNMKPLFQTQVH